MTTSDEAFRLLDERVQRFIWREGWPSLRDAQIKAIPLIVRGDRDVIVAAATAAGKTEAAFFPALTHMAAQAELPLIIYVSPLKALINDQLGRLERLCEMLEIPVTPWHGDVGNTVKERFRKSSRGVLLITPESLEAMLCTRGSQASTTFALTSFFIIDEMHSFLGGERGKQLQSLLHRIELAIDRKVPRVGLSATLGDMRLAADFLRPGAGEQVTLVESSTAGGALKILVRGYTEPKAAQTGVVEEISVGAVPAGDEDDLDEELTVAPSLVARDLFRIIRGSNNLVFPNSRTEVERYTALLNGLCDQLKIAHEFWPHHGSLSKEIREETERALKRQDRTASAICTNTLELGIDIGAVRSVCQVGAPSSVASLRQRLGRSGRRDGEPAMLWGFTIEPEMDEKATIAAALRLKTLQLTAAIALLLERWFEPPATAGMHLSTLVQQVLSFVAERNGATFSQLYKTFCRPGAPFAAVTQADLMELLRHLGKQQLLMQDAGGTLLHGTRGEKEVNHYSFYASFAADEEFKVSSRGRIMGTIPVTTMLMTGQRILFGGRRWTIESIDEVGKLLELKKARGGAKPVFVGGAGRVHSRVRAKMRELLEGNMVPTFLNSTARHFLEEARGVYRMRGLAQTPVLDDGSTWYLLTWLGDPGNEALACLLTRVGWVAAVAGPGLELQKGGRDRNDLMNALCRVAREPVPELDELLADVANLQREKWDHALTPSLLRKSYASLYLDVDEARAWADGQTKGMADLVLETKDFALSEEIAAAGRALSQERR